MFWKINGPNESEDNGSTGGGDAAGGGGQNSENDRRSRVLARNYSMFNATRWTATRPLPCSCLSEPERIGHAQVFFAGLGANIRHGGNRACYVLGLD